MMNTLIKDTPQLTDSLSLQAPSNLVYNHDFRYFSHADYNVTPIAYGVPDGWIYEDDGPGGGIRLDNDTLIIKTSNDDTSTMTFKQALHEFPRWREKLCGKRVSARIHTHLPADCLLSASLYDGVTRHDESWSNAIGGYHVFELSLDISNDAEYFYLALQCRANAAEIQVSTSCANVGEKAIDGLACIVQGVIGETKQYIVTENAPAEELSLCARSGPRELTENETRLDSVIAGRFGFGPNNRSMLPDMRGYFVRVWDNGANVDPNAAGRTPLGTGSKIDGDHVGTVQPDEFKSHQHDISFSPGVTVPGGKETALTPVNTLKGAKTEETGGKETRGKNLYQLFTIKWA